MKGSFILVAVFYVAEFCMADLDDVTTIYRFDNADIEESLSTIHIDNSWSIMDWTSSGWITKNSAEINVLSPQEDDKICPILDNGITEILPLNEWKQFTVSLNNSNGESYIFFLTQKNPDFADLLILVITSSNIKMLSCKYGAWGHVFKFVGLGERRCLDVEYITTPNIPEMTENPVTFYFNKHSSIDIGLTSDRRKLLLEIREHYFQKMKYVAMGSTINSTQFIFRSSEEVMALTEPTGELTAGFEAYSCTKYRYYDSHCAAFVGSYCESYEYYPSHCQIFLNISYYIDRKSAGEIELQLVDNYGHITSVGTLFNHQEQDSWKIHRFMLEMPSNFRGKLKFVGRKNSSGNVLIHRVGWNEHDNIYHDDLLDWDSTSFPFSGSVDIHALSSSLGKPFVLHNGSIVGPNVEVDLPACPDAHRNCNWSLEKWTTPSLQDDITKSAPLTVSASDNFMLELQEDEGCITSPVFTPTTDQLCVSLFHYISDNATVTLTAEFLGGIKMELQRLNETKGWKHLRILKQLTDSNMDLPMQLVLRGYKSAEERILVQRIGGCHPEADRLDLGRQANLRIFNLSIAVAPMAETGLLPSPGACMNGGRPTAQAGCVCPPGFGGDYCERACGPDRFGSNCTGRCSRTGRQCRGMYLCRPLWGCGCAPGYSGFLCNKQCEVGTYGVGCLQKCGHCAGKPCDIFTGSCPDDCLEGFHPPLCQQRCPYLVKPPQVSKSGNTLTITVNGSDANLKGKGTPMYYEIQSKESNDLAWEGSYTVPVNRSESSGLQEVRLPAPSANALFWIRAIIITSDGRSYRGDDLPIVLVNTSCIDPEDYYLPEPGDYLLETSDVTENSFLATWQALSIGDTYCPISHYELSVKEDWRWTIYAETNQTSFNISNRTPGERYAVRVRAVTLSGVPMPYSETVWETTSRLAAVAVKNLRVAKAESTQLLLEWDYPYLPLSTEKNFFVNFQCQRLLGCATSSCDHSKGELRTYGSKATLRGLLPHAQYSVSVAVIGGDVEPSVLIKAITLPAGSVPSTVEEPVSGRTDSSFSVHWAPPAECSKLNGLIGGYKYLLREEGSEIVLEEGTTTETTATFTGLDPGTKYEVDVLPLIGVEWDQDDNRLTIPVRTRGTGPGPVTNLTVYKTSRRLVGLRWGPPLETIGELRSFVVTYAEVRVPERTTTLEVPSETCSAWPDLYCATIHSLRANKQYSFTVRARCDKSVEDGKPTTVTARTREDAPEAPSFLQIVAKGPTELSVQWGIPNLLNGNLRRFFVAVEQVDSDNSGACCDVIPTEVYEVKSEEPSYQHPIRGLQPASSYIVVVTGQTTVLGPGVNGTVHTPSLAADLPTRPEVTVDEYGENIFVQLTPVADNKENVKEYLLLLRPDGEVIGKLPEGTTWDGTCAEELRAAVNTSFYIIGKYMHEWLVENREIVLTSPLSDVGGMDLVLSREQVLRLALVVVSEYDDECSVSFKESEAFTIPWLSE